MDTLHSVIDWCRRGYYPVPVPYREKGPKHENWQELRITAETAGRYFNGVPQNAGVLQGDNGACDVDLDSREAVIAFPEFAPETALIFGRASKPRSHWFYRVDPPCRSVRYMDPVDHQTLLEFRCLKTDGTVGLQTIVPPSVHPSGEAVEFTRGFDGQAANVDARELAVAVKRTAAVALLGRHWPSPQGGRHDAFLALAGGLARARWAIAEAIRLVEALYRVLWPGNPDLTAAAREVESTYQRYDDGHETTGLPHLLKLVDPAAAKQAIKWLDLWQEPKPKTASILEITALPSIWSLEGKHTWVIDGLLSEGSVNLLTGDSGDGKSTLALALAGAVAHGREFLGRATIRRHVLYIDRENPLFTIKERLARLHIGETADMHYWGLWVDPAPQGPASPSILEFVRKFRPLIVFDSLVAFHEGSEKDATETRQHMNLYRKLAAEGATIVVLHHTGKSETSKEYRGSSDIKAAADMGFVLERTDGSAAGSELAGLRLVPFKSRFIAINPIRLDYAGGAFLPTDGPVATPQEIMLDALRLNPGGVRLDLVGCGRKRGLGRNQAEEALDNLVLAGKAVVRRGKHGGHRFYLPDQDPMAGNGNVAPHTYLDFQS